MEYAFTCECKCLFGRYVRDNEPVQADCPLCGATVTDALSMSRTANGTRSINVVGDIQPYRSVIDGSIIGGRRQHRDHLRAHGCIEVGNENLKPSETDKPMPRAGHDIARALEQGGR